MILNVDVESLESLKI